MSTPGGFETGPDFVAAKLSIDVPTESISTLRELSQQIDRFRTSTENAARGSGDFVKYLQQIIEAGKQATEVLQNQAAALERTVDINSRAQAGSGGGSAALPLSRTVPQGYVDNFAGMGGAGMGSSGANRTPTTTADMQSQLADPLAHRDPVNYINAAAGRGHRQAGLSNENPASNDFAGHAQRLNAREETIHHQAAKTPGFYQNAQGGVDKYSGLAHSMMNEMAPGGTALGRLGALRKGMGGLGSLGGDLAGMGEEGGLMAGLGGGLMGGAGMAALGIGGAAAGLGLVEKGGSVYQGFKNQGLIRGGGAAQGFGSEMATMNMALNPFISMEQARNIIQSGLTEGYSGKQFDTVTQFMADNIKNMNVSVSDSVDLLRKNVNEGGQSVAALGASLGVLKGLSQNGSTSMPDLVQSFKDTSGALVNAGVSGGQASQSAMVAANMFNGNQTLKGVGGQMVQDMTADPASSVLMAQMAGVQLPSGLLPQAIPEFLGNQGADVASKGMKGIVAMVSKRPGAKQKGTVAYMNAVATFQMMLKKIDPNNKAASDMSAATQLYDVYINGGDPAAVSQKQVDAQTHAVNSVPHSTMDTINKYSGAIGTSITDTFKGVIDKLHGDEGGADRARNDMAGAWNQANYDTSAEASNPVVDNLLSTQGGAGNIEVGAGGSWKKLDGSRAQMEALANGKMRWRHKGDQGQGTPLSETPAQGDPNFNTGGTTNVNFSPATVTIKIDQNGNATANPQQVSLQPNQVRAMAGESGAQMNNPSASDQANYRRFGYGGR